MLWEKATPKQSEVGRGALTVSADTSSKSDVKVTDQPTFQCDSIGYLHYCVWQSWTQNAIMSSDRQIASSNPTAVVLLILVIVLIHASHDSLRSSLLLNSYN